MKEEYEELELEVIEFEEKDIITSSGGDGTNSYCPNELEFGS